MTGEIDQGIKDSKGPALRALFLADFEVVMSSATQSQGDLIELHFEDDAGQVRVTPSNSTLLLLSVEEAIAACRAFKQQLEFKDQFDSLLNTLWTWLKVRRAKISQAFLTSRDNGLLLLIVMKSAEYDRAFENEITELDVQVANDTDYHLIDLSVLAIPNCPSESVHSFLSRKLVLRLMSDGDGK